MALQKPGCVLMFVASHWSLGGYLKQCWCSRAMLLLVPGQSEWPALPPGSVVTSRLLPKDHVWVCVPKVHVGVQGPMPPPAPCRSWWSVLPLRAMVSSRHEQLLALSDSMTTATRIYFNNRSSCYHWRPSRCPGNGLPCEAMLVFKGHGGAGADVQEIAYSATTDHGHI